MKEIWKDISGYEGCYQISSKGNVRSVRNTRGKKTKPFLLRPYKIKGYPSVKLCVSFEKRSMQVHSLVLNAFAGTKPKGYCGAHLNGKRDDNRIENLKWVTYKENSAHRKIHGTMFYGEKANSAKLTDLETKEIRASTSAEATPDKNKAIAKKYKISYGHLLKILKNKTRVPL